MGALGEILFVPYCEEFRIRPPPPWAEVLFVRGRFPGDQVQKAKSAIRVQKQLRFAYKIEWNFEETPKSASNSLENKDSNGRDPRFPLFALGPLGNGPGRRGLPPRPAGRLRNSSQYGTKRIPPKGADEEDPPLRARTKRIPLRAPWGNPLRPVL